MTPYPFEYKRAASVDEALALLAEHGEEAKLLAGGHSLVPAMKMRLAAPSALIDVTGLAELTRIEREGDRLALGALATHRSVEHSDVVREACPVLSEAAGLIGDPQVRNRGTLGGSLAHADPAADYPALMLALSAEIHVTGRGGARTVAADDFFRGMFETAVQPGEMITKVTVPVTGTRAGAAYHKFAHPASRYAVVGVAAHVRLAADGTCEDLRVGVTGAAPVAFRAAAAEDRLRGQALDEEAVTAAVEGMVGADGLLSDHHASAAYRAHLVEVMARRAIRQAADRAA